MLVSVCDNLRTIIYWFKCAPTNMAATNEVEFSAVTAPSESRVNFVIF